MCGIIGWKSKAVVDKQRVKTMAQSLAHRGPDGEGFYYSDDGTLAFAHKRLAIIDPEHGQQPMQTADGDLSVSFNGAIYNFLELRRELIANLSRSSIYSP